MTNSKFSQAEYAYSGLRLPGLLMLVIMLALLVVSGLIMVPAVEAENGLLLVLSIVLAIADLFLIGCGFVLLEPNQASVLMFLGKYKGTLRNTGYWWINPFYGKRKVSLRANNLDVAPIKVNDKTGNPVMIGMVLVWKVDDTYRALFDIDASSSLRSFVAIQADAALREVAGHYAYDTDDRNEDITLRSGGDVINELLESKINERLAIAGVSVIEARINYIAYAPEIAAVMLRRQQAAAIISAREKIVEGAVSMVEMALGQLESRNLVTLDNDRKASIVGNLLMVLCSDEGPQTVIPAKES